MATFPPFLLLHFLFLFLIFLLLPAPSSAYDPTPPPKGRGGGTPRSEDNFGNPITKPILTGRRIIHITKFAQIPDFISPNTGKKRPSRLVGLTSYGSSVYVTTSTSGAYIYKIPLSTRKPILWANIQSAVLQDTGRNVNCETAQHGGLRSVAFPPDHSKTGLFYVSYMEDRPNKPTEFVYLSRPKQENPIVADSVVVEFKYDFDSGKVVNGSYRTVIRIGLETKDHPIKQIAFMDRFLLIGHGDGALGSNPSPGGMNNDGLGKILRVDPRRTGDKPYRIPWNNPWANGNNGGVYMPEIYAVGFRNPHNTCWSPKHGIFVADVGRDNVEEVNIVTSGGNYGWGEREGTFVNLYDGGTINGVKPLPKDDAKYEYTYPAVQIGHNQPVGGQIRWGLAIAGACPIENNSTLKNLYFYAHFGERGELWYSWVGAMKRAVTKGDPKNLSQAWTYRARRILFYKNGMKDKAVEVDSLVGVIREDSGNQRARRVDVRFGRGPRGEVLITSKTTGAVYVIANSVPYGEVV